MAHSANNNTQSLITEFNDLPTADHYFIAYSGGMDSTALLHALSLDQNLSNHLTAIHINHNINSASEQWADHCQQQCKALNIPLIIEAVHLPNYSEATCRQARQHIFKQHLKPGDCLLTAHHQNDQIETVLFRLLRGTGLQGMTGISPTNKFEHYTIHRPLLNINRQQIKAYVQTNQLCYVEDPSNHDNQYSRNHLRNLIIPELEKYDDQVVQNIKSTVQNLNLSQQLLNHFIGNNNPFNYHSFTGSDQLSTALYHWLHNLKVRVPNRKRLRQFSQDCLQAANDKNPELDLDECKLIRWQQHIYALAPSDTELLLDSKIEIELNSNVTQIVLPFNGKIIFTSTTDVTIPAIIKYQQSHERIQLKQNSHHKKLKKLFQQSAIPPWERHAIPYLYIDNQLMAVGSNIKSADFQNILSEYNAEYHWLSPQFLL
jgi:tRNA(Ile)-lysidine synthase